MKSKKRFYGGYGSRWSTGVILLFNGCLAGILICIASPLMLIIALLILSRNGTPILYKGVRMGLNKKTFVMYKFRTLPEGAQQIIGQEVLAVSHQMTTPLTKFLRDTRLDELPQLFNVLKGDMDFVGPRPERPEIYENICRDINGYDLRFSVRPGLIGYSQLFTPHSTPKTIRTKIDNHLIRQKQSLPETIYIISYTIAVVLKEVVVQGSTLLARAVKSQLLVTYCELRKMERVVLRNVVVQIVSAEQGNEPCDTLGSMVDINEGYFKIETDRELTESAYLFFLQCNVYRWRRIKVKKASCYGDILRRDKGKKKQYAYVVKYQPSSPLNKYKIDQYFLKKSLA